MFKLEQLYQPVSRKCVLQWANRTGKWWWVLNASTANNIPGGPQWQTTIPASYTGPWQLGFTWRANTDCSTSLATEDTAWRQQEVQARIPPLLGNMVTLFRLTVSGELFILQTLIARVHMIRQMDVVCMLFISCVFSANFLAIGIGRLRTYLSVICYQECEHWPV